MDNKQRTITINNKQRTINNGQLFKQTTEHSIDVHLHYQHKYVYNYTVLHTYIRDGAG